MSGPPASVLPLPGTPSSGPPGPAPPGAPPPGGPPGREPFQSALAEEWARTAPAEGHKSEGKQKNEGQPRRPRSPQEGGEPAAVSIAAQAARTEQAGRKPRLSPRADSTAKPGSQAKAATTPARAQTRGPLSPDLAADATSDDAKAAPGAQAPTAPAGAGKAPLPDHADPQPAAASAPKDASRVPTGNAPETKAASTASGEPATPPASTPVAAPPATPVPSSERSAARARPPASAPPAASTGPTARVATAKAASHAPAQPASGPSAPSTSPQTTGTGSTGIAPAAQGSAAGGAVLLAQEGTGVRLQDMIDSIRSTIELSVRQGTTQARIALSPESLGDIRIHLTQSSAGLLARVTAGTADAAKVLAQGRAELQHSLSGLGLSLLGLDIGLSGQGAWSDGRLQGGPQAKNAAGGKTDGEQDDEAEAITPAEAGPSGPAKGDLVDVLA